MAFVRGSANYATHGFIATHFSATIPVHLDHLCVALDCVNREWESEFDAGGDIARLRELGDITINDWTVDGTTTYETVTESYQDIVIDQQKYFAFKVDHVDIKQASVDVLDGYAERAAINLRDTIDTHLLTGLSSGVPVDNILGATTLGSVITVTPESIYSVLVDLRTLLVESKAFSVNNQLPWLIVPPSIRGVMLKSGQLTPPTEMGDKLIRSGVFGEFAGWEVKETTNTTLTAATGGSDDYFSVLGGVNYAHTFAMQINDVEGPFTLQTTFGEAMRGLAVYGSKTVKGQGLVKLICKV